MGDLICRSCALRRGARPKQYKEYWRILGLCPICDEVRVLSMMEVVFKYKEFTLFRKMKNYFISIFGNKNWYEPR
jgi:hypothetical protein